MSKNCDILKDIWFPGMGADFIKYWKTYCLITGKGLEKDYGTVDVFNEQKLPYLKENFTLSIFFFIWP